ncbi:MAG TPA: family 1 encapsulin nanocompartment shell protein [Methanocorpusculum sp.]|nr:family 1 encapsulin nanocompartment shell protein [Methanocorpusculum sp.]
MQNTPFARAATQISRQLINPLRTRLMGRRLASINPEVKGEGTSAFEYTHISGISDAFVQWKMVTGSEQKDSITASSRIVQIPCLSKEFEMPKSDIAAWEQREVGVGEENSLPSVTANAAAYEVARKEDQMIFDGWKPDGSTYGVKGFAQAANNTVTGGSIATAGTMCGYLCDAIAALNEDEVFGENNSYNLSITPAIYGALMPKRFQNGDTELKQIRDFLGDGDILVTPHVPSGTAIVTPVDTAREHFEFLNPVDYKVEFANPKYNNIGMQEGVVYELFLPSYIRPNGNGKTDAVCKITSLSA